MYDRQRLLGRAHGGTLLYANQLALRSSGLTLGEVRSSDFLATIAHPDDLDRIHREHHAGLSKKLPFDVETRVFFKSAGYRWQLFPYNPPTDESGQVTRWYVTATDIDDRKRDEERLLNENLVLRGEIDRRLGIDKYGQKRNSAK